VNFSGQNSTDSDGTIVSYSWDFGNGTGATGAAPSCTYTTAGTFIAVLTVTDNDGLASSASVAITVMAPVNAEPIAVASASTTAGTAPLPITFSSNGSTDPDGSINSYLWTFGDGTSSTEASPAKTYSAPGNYTAVLKVTDNLGASSTASLAVSVAGDQNKDVDVSGFSLSKSTTNGGISAIAKVIVLNRAGNPVSGVTVNLQWSGLVSTKSSGMTDANGQVLLSSGRTKKAGTITGTITAVAPPTGTSLDSTISSTPWVQSIVTK
jgi:PKD repeat protein